MSTHHAQLLRTKDSALSSALARYGEVTEAEVCPLIETSIGIGEVRKVIEQANLRPSNGTYRLVVVITEGITQEAQQALLKILEEPPETTRFLFVLPPEVALLKTVLSRFEVIAEADVAADSEHKDFAEFLHFSYAERLDLITKELVKKESIFVPMMRKGFARYLSAVGFTLKENRALGFLIVERLGTRGASNKMLLEALALLLPIVQKK